MEKITTNDGSITYYNKYFKEAYHSVSGAVEEAFKKYAEPCKIRPGMKILDICFGLGYNSAAALYKTKELKIIALENDKKILRRTATIKVPNFLKETYSIIRKSAKNLNYKDEKTEIKILLGDARKTIQEINEKFDTVFLDPFSTTKNPELWTVEFFKEIKKRIKDSGILATYSSAALVRNGLLEAGFKIGNGPVVGRTRPSTLASIKAKLPKLTKEDLVYLRLFGKQYHDQGLNWSRKEIIKNRENLL